jgi:hypothetical protein
MTSDHMNNRRHMFLLRFYKRSRAAIHTHTLPHLKHQLPPQMPPFAHPVRRLRIRQRIAGDLRQLHRT